MPIFFDDSVVRAIEQMKSAQQIIIASPTLENIKLVNELARHDKKTALISPLPNLLSEAEQKGVGKPIFKYYENSGAQREMNLLKNKNIIYRVNVEFSPLTGEREDPEFGMMASYLVTDQKIAMICTHAISIASGNWCVQLNNLRLSQGLSNLFSYDSLEPGQRPDSIPENIGQVVHVTPDTPARLTKLFDWKGVDILKTHAIDIREVIDELKKGGAKVRIILPQNQRGSLVVKELIAAGVQIRYASKPVTGTVAISSGRVGSSKLLIGSIEPTIAGLQKQRNVSVLLDGEEVIVAKKELDRMWNNI